MRSRIVSLLFMAAASVCSGISFAMSPTTVKEYINADVIYRSVYSTMGTFYVLGIINSVKTIQNIGLIGYESSICMPDGKVTLGNIRSAINSVDPYVFPDTDDGGVMYTYTALSSAYPCR